MLNLQNCVAFADSVHLYRGIISRCAMNVNERWKKREKYGMMMRREIHRMDKR